MRRGPAVLIQVGHGSLHADMTSGEQELLVGLIWIKLDRVELSVIVQVLDPGIRHCAGFGNKIIGEILSLHGVHGDILPNDTLGVLPQHQPAGGGFIQLCIDAFRHLQLLEIVGRKLRVLCHLRRELGDTHLVHVVVQEVSAPKECPADNRNIHQGSSGNHCETGAFGHIGKLLAVASSRQTEMGVLLFLFLGLHRGFLTGSLLSSLALSRLPGLFGLFLGSLSCFQGGFFVLLVLCLLPLLHDLCKLRFA